MILRASSNLATVSESAKLTSGLIASEANVSEFGSVEI